MRVAAVALLFTLAAACTPKTGGVSPAAGGSGGSGGQGGAGGTGGTGGTGGSTVSACEELGLPVRAFDAAASGTDFDQPVTDFTLKTLDGDYHLAERWSGCDSYVFMVTSASSSFTQQLLQSRVSTWLEASPANVQYFFLSYDADAQGEVERIRGIVEQGMASLDEASRANWTSRIHYVTEPALTGGGWIGPFIGSYRTSEFALWGFAIDRQQVLREVGYFADPSTNWNTIPLRNVGYEVEHYNFEAERQAHLDADGARVIRAFDKVETSDPNYTNQAVFAEIELPDAATMATYDTLELDLSLTCGGHPEVSKCAEWDSNVDVFLCDREDPATPEHESDTCKGWMGRWITPYARAGRWVMDASQFLAELQDGGTRRIRLYSQVKTISTLDLRLRNAGKELKPFAMQRLWDGARRAFDAQYDENHLPVTFTPPPGTRAVELSVMLSGHGAEDTEYCAEFCNHEHEFTLNGGTPHRKSHPEAGTTFGCAQTVGEGTSPNQYGTWIFGRGGWCPGREVARWTADLTPDAHLDGENTLEYHALVNGKTYDLSLLDGKTGPGSIDMAAYLVFLK